ncbi:MAG: DNA topoisomerase 3 [Candidatus Amulumruptor caecigallinarius]|nr:DNA topoisomerase 3 [Candidatus Amulumruptor caecigallinarius]
MILCITEKPSVAKDIARILGANTSRQGYFEGNGYCVTWTFGHLCTLKEPADYTPMWKHWAISMLPMIPHKFGIKLIDDAGIKKQFETIRTLIGECEYVINCGDAGQEGELIQRWVMQKAGCKKPVKRLWVSSLTDEAVKEGFAKLREHKDLDSLYEAGLCRAIGDWILGINATRLYTIKYGVDRKLLSVGRVQTPTLALVVKRQQEIENFVPENSWEVRTKYRNVVFISTLKAFKEEQKGKEVVERIMQHPFEVTDVTKKRGKEAPPRLFDLTSLQVECNKKFGMSADITLKTIQSLYEKKLATYPRVDTTYLTDDIYPKCGGILNGLKQYENLFTPLRGSKLKKSKKVFDNAKVTDHHAIIPTGQPIPPTLSDFEMKVFDTIARRFISVFYPDCVFEQTVVEGKVSDVKFKTTGRIIVDPGWKRVYSKMVANSNTVDSDAEGENAELPSFIVGESGPHEPFLGMKTTQPPKYYTEGTLLRAMETAGSTVEDEDLRESLKANGIGRPSTRATIIEILYKRGYIRKERKSIRATEAGVDLISIIKEDLLKSASLTGIWEGKLRRIERGDYSASEFMEQLKEMVKEITLSVMRDSSNRRIVTQVPNDTDKKS